VRLQYHRRFAKDLVGQLQTLRLKSLRLGRRIKVSPSTPGSPLFARQHAYAWASMSSRRTLSCRKWIRRVGSCLAFTYSARWSFRILAGVDVSKYFDTIPHSALITVRGTEIEEYGVERWLTAVGEEVRTARYTPQPVKRVMIPEPGGAGQRPLGIPNIRDRVVQTAATLVLEPIFEADFDEAAYGYRPKRSALDAVRTVHRAIKEGHTDIVDAVVLVTYADDFVVLCRHGCRGGPRNDSPVGWPASGSR
jgi:hypothetical protein